MTDKRDSNIELLRIVAMLFIIAFHCVQHTGGSAFELMKSPFSMNLCITVLLGSFGNVSVALFVIISSWFLADREGIHSKKLVILTFQAWFLSMAVTGAVYALGYRKISLSIFLKEMLTPAYSQYWFITTYIVFYLTVPLLQYIVRTMREESLKKLCIIFTILIPCYNCFFCECWRFSA